MDHQIHNIAIIGSGPAGYTAALYAARGDLAPILFAGPQPGGQLTITTEVENYPGFPDGVMGPEMMVKFREQAVRFGTKVLDETVSKVNFDVHPFEITADSGMHYAKAIIISTGASAKWLGVPGEAEFGGFGVSACATCDGFFFKNKTIIVVGGGDTAMEEANYLTKHAAKVILIHRRHDFRASKIMTDRVMQNPKVEVKTPFAIDEIMGQTEPFKKIGAVKLRNTETGETSEMPIDGVFVAIGHKPNSDLFLDKIEHDEVGYLIAKPDSTATNIPGVFVAGDVADAVYRQAVTAAGKGCQAALDAERWLEANGHH